MGATFLAEGPAIEYISPLLTIFLLTLWWSTFWEGLSHSLFLQLKIRRITTQIHNLERFPSIPEIALITKQTKSSSSQWICLWFSKQHAFKAETHSAQISKHLERYQAYILAQGKCFTDLQGNGLIALESFKPMGRNGCINENPILVSVLFSEAVACWCKCAGISRWKSIRNYQNVFNKTGSYFVITLSCKESQSSWTVTWIA